MPAAARLQRYRLVQPKPERQMMQSLPDYGQLSPIVVCQFEGQTILVDGFKRLHAARSLKGITQLSAPTAGIELRIPQTEDLGVQEWILGRRSSLRR